MVKRGETSGELHKKRCRFKLIILVLFMFVSLIYLNTQKQKYCIKPLFAKYLDIGDAAEAC